MPDAIFTLDSLVAGAPAPTLLRLRVLDRRLSERIAHLDAEVDALLRAGGSGGLDTDDAVAAVDVLCAAMAEVGELRDEARRQIARELAARRARRSGVRRWH